MKTWEQTHKFSTGFSFFKSEIIQLENYLNLSIVENLFLIENYDI